MYNEPKYNEDVVNLGYLNKILGSSGDKTNDNVRIPKMFATQPKTPYFKGDVWINGKYIYVCVNTRNVGLFNVNDWTTESGAKDLAFNKSKVYITQPTNYQMGDMWILQTDNDHPLGKKGEILIADKNGKEYMEADWVKEISYITQDEKTEIDEKIQTATNSIAELKTTSNQISAKVQETEVKLNDIYTKEDIEAMNGELSENLETVSKRVGSLEISSKSVSAKVKSIENIVTDVEEKAIIKVKVLYALGDNVTVAPTGGWSETAPTWQSGKYMWQRTVVEYADGNTTTSDATNISGAKGQDGTDGKDGQAGKDGTSITITAKSITYQMSTLGVTVPTGMWSTTIPTLIEGQYLWTKNYVKYSDNTENTSYSVSYIAKDGIKGDKGDTGATGSDGRGILNTVIEYQKSSSGTVIPTGTWSTTIPTVGASEYLWTRTTISYTTGSDSVSYSVGMVGATGAKGDKGDTGTKGDTGIGVKSLETQYYLSTSNTTQFGGEWKNTQDEWQNGKYYWTRSKITWTDNTVTYTTPELAEALNNANNVANDALNNTTVTNTTEKAKEFHLTDSADSNCKSVEIFGESTQETREGYNLIKYSDSFRATTAVAKGISCSLTTEGYLQFDVERR